MVLGDGNVLDYHAVVGSRSQARASDGEGRLMMGDRNFVHPFAVINRGSLGDAATRVGNDCIFMQASHVAHDCLLGDGIVVSNYAAVAGHAVIGDHAIIGGHALIAQRLRIGGFAHVLPRADCRRDVHPFETFDGVQRSRIKLNARAVRKLGGTITDIRAIRDRFGGMSIDDARRERLHPLIAAHLS